MLILLRTHKIVCPVIAFLALLIAVACSSGSKPASESAQNSNRITGAGSTFIYPVMTRWISDFQSNHAGVQINYQSIGSGGGIQQMKKGLVDFGASDLPVAQIRNKAGNWVDPTPSGTTAAIDAFSNELAKDVRTPIVDPPATAKDAYPISGLTFLIIPKEGKNPATTRIVKDFTEYIIMQGQEEAEKISYAKLPATLQQQDQNLLAQVAGQSNQASAKTQP